MWKLFPSELTLLFSQEAHIPEQGLNNTSTVASKAAYIKKWVLSHKMCDLF